MVIFSKRTTVAPFRAAPASTRRGSNKFSVAGRRRKIPSRAQKITKPTTPKPPPQPSTPKSFGNPLQTPEPPTTPSPGGCK